MLFYSDAERSELKEARFRAAVLPIFMFNDQGS
jgi:hypothetical protein